MTLQKAAEEGNAIAQHQLGWAYHKGEGVLQSYEDAVHWFIMSARQGYVKAQVSVGLAYAKGEGVLQDESEAAGWFQKAAEQGDIDGQYMLAHSYASGRGVPQDFVVAHKWANLAGANGHPDASKIRTALETEMTTEQIKEAQAMARAWQPTKTSKVFVPPKQVGGCVIFLFATFTPFLCLFAPLLFRFLQF